MLLARTLSLEPVDLVVPPPGQDIVNGIGDDRDQNQDGRRQARQRHLLLVDHLLMVRPGSCEPVGRASPRPPEDAIAERWHRAIWRLVARPAARAPVSLAV